MSILSAPTTKILIPGAERSIQKVLIIQTAYPGDVILTTPLIAATQLIFPNARIDFLTTPVSANLIETQPAVNRVIVFAKRGPDRGIRGLLRLVKKLRTGEKYDLALIPHRSWRSAALPWAAQIRTRLGFNTSAAPFFFTHQIQYQKHWHEVERNLHLLSIFEPTFPKILPRIYPDAADEQIIVNFLAANNLLQPKPLIAIAPGSVWETKKWLKEGFAELCQLIAAEFQSPVLLIGGQSDQALCDWIVAHSFTNVYNTAGQFTLRQSAALLSRCQVLVTNDSAPLHLGVAAQIPVIALFGPTVPAFGFYPYGPNDLVIEKAVACRPCGIHGGKRCPTGTFLCMRGITAHEILLAIKSKLVDSE
ncbi:glycosyltransferase family 9 protein [candidate division KSB1 bacterium]|nr:glycosyltransferase family 9 protein [candidate division KSB1 bacterium]